MQIIVSSLIDVSKPGDLFIIPIFRLLSEL